MLLTGHWNRIKEWTSAIESDELDHAKQTWQDRWCLYCRQVNAHLANGGSIRRNRKLAFEFIVERSLIEIQQTIDMIDILKDKTPPRHVVA